MVKTGRPRKKAGQAQGHRQHLALVAAPAATAGGFTIPAPPTRADDVPLSARTLLAWDAFWGTAVARAVDLPADQRQLEQYFRDIDEFQRLQAPILKDPLVVGSQGQPRLNPLIAREESLDARMRRTEENFGLTPRDGDRMGLAAGQAALTADEFRRRLTEGYISVPGPGYAAPPTGARSR